MCSPESFSPIAGRQSWLMVLLVSGSKIRRTVGRCVKSSSDYLICPQNVCAGGKQIIFNAVDSTLLAVVRKPVLPDLALQPSLKGTWLEFRSYENAGG